MLKRAEADDVIQRAFSGVARSTVAATAPVRRAFIV
jgi:hypothetical protein